MLIAGFKVLFNYPAWFSVLCLLCGGAYAAVLYYKSHRDGFSGLLKWALASLRFVSVSILAFLLLAPLLERLSRHVEEPILIFVQDNSQSILSGAPAAFDLPAYIAERNQFLADINRHYDVRTYAFGEAFRPFDPRTSAVDENLADQDRFTDRLTDIAGLFSAIESQYSNRNIGGIILASDGLYNRGVNPVFASSRVRYPVYTLALGDTIPRKDIVLSRLRHNRITYLGNTFPLEVWVEARQLAGETTTLTVSRSGEVLYTRQVGFDSDHHLETILVELEADMAGMQRYRVALSPVNDEVSITNNSQEFFIDIIDGRQSVLILANAPHPDIGAIQMALESGGNFETTTFLFHEFTGTPEAYNLVILHQLPAAGVSMQTFFQQLNQTEVPVLYVVGSQTDLEALTRQQSGFTFTTMSNEMVEALPHHNMSFALFSLSDQQLRLLGFFPPLYAPFARYELTTASHVMLTQRIGQVITEHPLIAFSQSGSRKTGLIAGEGIWRWRLHTFLREGNHQLFDEMISGMVQYLSLQEDKKLFRLKHQPFVFENESVIIDAELYNQSYELVNEPEVNLIITNEDGVSFPYVMARTSNAYTLSAGSFPPGNYTIRATTRLGGELLQAEGIFSIVPLNIEDRNIIADHNLLFQLASNSGGELFYPGQWDELHSHLTNRDDVKSVLYARQTLDELINVKWIFFLILLLLSAEWFARKRAGSY